jgi:hypothetical protein
MRDSSLLLVTFAFALGAVGGTNWPSIRQKALEFIERSRLIGELGNPGDLIVLEKTGENAVHNAPTGRPL